jgi:hypothetical protein
VVQNDSYAKNLEKFKKAKEWLFLAIIFLLVNDEVGAFVINWKVKLISKVILYLNIFAVFTHNFFSLASKATTTDTDPTA